MVRSLSCNVPVNQMLVRERHGPQFHVNVCHYHSRHARQGKGGVRPGTSPFIAKGKLKMAHDMDLNVARFIFRVIPRTEEFS